MDFNFAWRVLRNYWEFYGVFFFFFVAAMGFNVGLRRISWPCVSWWEGGTNLQFPKMKVVAQLSDSGTCSTIYL